MPKAGNLKSTFIVTSDDLKVNGGRWLLQSGPAIRVRGFNTSSIGDRRIIGGDALPIYILAESDARVNGGQFLLKGGQPIQVTDVIGSARGVIQGKAIPVWPVDDDGNYDPTFVGYSGKVIATGPIAYWIQGETAGAIAVDQINSPAQDGAYTGVTLGQPGIGDGNTAPLYDGINDFTNIYSVALNGVFDGQEGSCLIWGRVANVGVWTDATQRFLVIVRVNGTNQIFLERNAAANRFRWTYTAGGVTQTVDRNGENTIDWMALALTWSLSAGGTGEVKFYFNGVQEGATQVGLGAWVGALSANNVNIGTFSSAAPIIMWSGFAAHCIFWDRPITDSENLELATV